MCDYSDDQDITAIAIELHRKERSITLESIKLIAELRVAQPWVYLNMTMEKYAYFIGLTPSKFHKRLQVSRILQRHPRVLELYEKGETTISHIATIASRLTPANEDLLIEAIRNKSKREVEEFICRVTAKGEILEKQDTFEMTIRLSLDQKELLDRSREVLAHGGHVPANSELFEIAFKILLKYKDPVQKAERAKARADKLKTKNEDKEEVIVEEADNEDDSNNDEITGTLNQPWGTFKRKPIPAATRNAVWLRDKSQCTHVNGIGERCPERMMLEFDHIKMVCRGGGNEIENLRLRCRFHNQSEARRSLNIDDDGNRKWYPRAV